MSTSRLDIDSVVELILQTLEVLEKNRDPKQPLVRDLNVDPILDRLSQRSSQSPGSSRTRSLRVAPRQGAGGIETIGSNNVGAGSGDP